MKNSAENTQKRHKTKGGQVFPKERFSQIFIHGRLLKKEGNITYRRQGKARAEPYDIGIHAAKWGQEKDTKQHCRSADEIENKGLFFIPDCVEHRGGNHGKTHRQKEQTTVFNHRPRQGIRVCQPTQILPKREEKGD